jgi:large subunit ribosomal protein L35
MKSSRTLMKRIRITGTGKIKRHHAYKGHLAPNKTTKQKNHLAKATYVDKSDMPRLEGIVNTKVR